MAKAEKPTRTDALLRKIKDHWLLAPVIVLAIVVAAVAVFVTQVAEVGNLFRPSRETAVEPQTPEKPPATNTQLPTEPPVGQPTFQDRPATESKPMTPQQTASEPRKATRNAASQHPPAATERTDQFFIECQKGVMPSIVPPSGRIHVLNPDESDPTPGRGLADFFATPGATGWKFTSDGLPAWAYKCEVTNYTSHVVFNASIHLRLTFREVRPVPGNPNSRGVGPVTLVRPWEFTIPKLDPAPAAPYVFYIWNCCVERFVFVSLTEHATASQGRRIPIVQAAGNFADFLSPPMHK